MEYNGIEAGSSVDIAELFSDYFQSVYASVDNLDYPNIPPFQSNKISHISGSYYNVIGVLRTTNVNQTCGPDNISGVILRECATELAGPLTVLLPLFSKVFLRKWCMTHCITRCVTQFRAANTDL